VPQDVAKRGVRSTPGPSRYSKGPETLSSIPDFTWGPAGGAREEASGQALDVAPQMYEALRSRLSERCATVDANRTTEDHAATHERRGSPRHAGVTRSSPRSSRLLLLPRT